MALALPSVRLLPLAPSRATAPTSSPLSVTRTRPRALHLPRVRCCASRISHRAAAASEATPSWAGELASSVPWKAAVSGALALAVCFTCCKLASFSSLRCLVEQSWVEDGWRILVLISFLASMSSEKRSKNIFFISKIAFYLSYSVMSCNIWHLQSLVRPMLGLG